MTHHSWFMNHCGNTNPNPNSNQNCVLINKYDFFDKKILKVMELKLMYNNIFYRYIYMKFYIIYIGNRYPRTKYQGVLPSLNWRRRLGIWGSGSTPHPWLTLLVEIRLRKLTYQVAYCMLEIKRKPPLVAPKCCFTAPIDMKHGRPHG